MTVLRLRQEEIMLLKNFSYKGLSIPLLEIIKELPRKGSKLNFEQYYLGLLRNIKSKIVIDLPMYIPLTKSTKADVRKLLEPIYSNPNLRLYYLSIF